MSTQRRRLPDDRKSITHSFQIQDLKFYLNVGLYEDGTPGEIFLKVRPTSAEALVEEDLKIKTGGSHGGFASGMCNALAVVFSTGLQFGTPLEALCKGISHMAFEPADTLHRDRLIGPGPKSVADYVGRWMMAKFGPKEEGEKA